MHRKRRRNAARFLILSWWAWRRLCTVLCQVAAGVFPAPGRRAYRTLNMNAPSPLPAAPEHFTLADSPDVWSWNSHKFVELYRVARDGSVPNPRNPGTRAPADSLAATRRGCPNLLDG